MSVILSGAQREVVALLDSNGNIHAAWIDRDDLSAQGRESLWCSTYDPEAPRSATTRLVDRSASIDSLDMIVDDLDNIHIVWVRQTSDPGSLNATDRNAQARGIYYQRMLSDGTSLLSPKLLLESRTESLCAAVTSGRNDRLYVAWIETRRLDSGDAESNIYYGTLPALGSAFDITRTFVATTQGGSGMLKATASTDRRMLYLAWVDDLGDGRSGVRYSRVDFLENVSTTVSVEDLNGAVNKLAIAPTPEGDLVMGWVYYEPMLGERVVHLRRLMREGRATPIAVQIQPQQPSDVESMTLDSQGNLHLVWLDQTEEAPVTPRQAWVPRQRLLYTKLSGDGQSYQESREIPYGRVVAAFVLQNGEVYVVSQQRALETTRPVSTGSPLALVLALVLLTIVASGVSSETGTYLVASWADTASLSAARLMRAGSAGLCADLLRGIGVRPAVTLSDLKQLSSQNTMDVAMHLRILERLGVIQSVREGTKQRFYSVRSEAESLSRAGELRESIVRLVEQVPGITEAQIARRLGTSQQLANYHLRRLAGARILTRNHSPPNVRYVVNERVVASRKKNTGN
jgi:DNA-binding transcriptional ArsR family regulator